MFCNFQGERRRLRKSAAAIYMTSYERPTFESRRFSDTMREFRRPTLCVIDENGIEINHTTEFDSLPRSDVIGENNNGCKVTVNGDVSVCDHNANLTKVENGNFLSPHVEKDLDLCELKATTARLKLSTRRKSTVAWQQEHLDASRHPVIPKFDPATLQHKADDAFTEERKCRINEALAWLRSELVRTV